MNPGYDRAGPTDPGAAQRLRSLLGGERFAVGGSPRIVPTGGQGPAGVTEVTVEPGESVEPGSPGPVRRTDLSDPTEPTVPDDLTAPVSVPGFLLRPAPEVATGAAVVLVAGHGNGIVDLVRDDPADAYHGSLAHTFVAAGFTVLCPEMQSFGARRTPLPAHRPPYEPGESSCVLDTARYLLHGVPVLGRRVADAAVASDALRRLPGVDPKRVAVAGGSGGGAVALMLAAVDARVAGALVATYFCSFAASIGSIRHCPCNIVPGLLDQSGGAPALEMADIAGLVAPRPLVIEAGEQDPIFPIAATREAFATLPERWRIQGATEPELVLTPGGHRFVGERSVELLAQRLG